MTVCILVTSFSTFADNQLPEIPSDIKEKSSAEQAELMSQISQFSYQVLIDAPKKGLRAQSLLLKNIIATRKQLETVQLPLFQLLALRLQEGVERAIANEMYREDMIKQGFSEYTPVKEGSFDLNLLEHLLSLNELYEQKAIEYTVSLDGVIPNFCRQQNYPYEIYSKGLLLTEVSPDITKSVKELLNTFGMLGKLTEKQMADFLFTQTLLAIDQTRNLRLFFEVYKELEDLPKMTKQLDDLIEAKLPFGSKMKGQLSTGHATTALGDVISLLERYVEKRPGFYGSRLTHLFLPFITNTDVIPVEHRIITNYMEAGRWLTFKEEKDD